MKKFLWIVLAVIVLFVIYLGITYGPFLKHFFVLSVEKVDENMTICWGNGGNSVILKSDDGQKVLVVDTKMGGGAKRLEEIVRKMAPEAEVTIVNTHFHGDHTGGNKRFPNAHVIAGAYETDQWIKQSGMNRMPDVILPVGTEKTLAIGDEIVLVRNIGRGHSWNDVIVYFQNRKLLATGDLFFHTWHPVIIETDGGDVDSWIQDLEYLLETYEPTAVVPGHGPKTDRHGLESVLEYFTSIRDAVGDESRLAELKAKYKNWMSMPGMSGFDKTVICASRYGE